MKAEPTSTRLIRIEDKLDMALDTLAKHNGVLYGNGQPGLIRDMDRVQQVIWTMRRWFWVAISGGVAILSTELAHFLFFK